MPRPIVTNDLLTWLEETFPDRLPRPAQDNVLPTDRDVARLVGQQDVIRKLRQIHRADSVTNTLNP